MQGVVVVAAVQHGGQEVAVVVLVERDGTCPVLAQAGENLVGLREVSGSDAVAVVVVPPAFVRHIGAASPY